MPEKMPPSPLSGSSQDAPGIALETPISLRRTLGIAGLVFAIALPIAMRQSRGDDWVGPALGALMGLLVASIYFKKSRLTFDKEKLVLTKTWFVRYVNREIPFRDVTGLHVSRDVTQGDVYEIRFGKGKLKFSWTEFSSPRKLFDALSRALGIPVTRVL
jgi:hypothetical protein